MRRYAVNPDGTLGAFTNFTDGVGIGDGIKTDTAGNVYSSGGAGLGIVRITSPTGTLLGTINLPIYGGEPKRQICSTNEAFGGCRRPDVVHRRLRFGLHDTAEDPGDRAGAQRDEVRNRESGIRNQGHSRSLNPILHRSLGESMSAWYTMSGNFSRMSVAFGRSCTMSMMTSFCSGLMR